MTRRQYVTAYVFITPVLFTFIVFVLIPLIVAVYLSFTNSNMVRVTGWAGFNNYVNVLKDSTFARSLLNALLFTLMYVPCIIVGSLFVAALLNRKMVGSKIFRAIYYLPAITSGVAAAFVWMWMMSAADYGFFNQILTAFGLPTAKWLGGKFAIVSIAIISIWGGVAGNMLIFLAALQGVPKELLEAAYIDGCGKAGQFFRITVPWLRPTIYFIFTLSVIGAFQLFDIVYLTTGGQNPATVTPVVDIYWSAFREHRGGVASAMSVILMIVIIAFTVITQAAAKAVGGSQKAAGNAK